MWVVYYLRQVLAFFVEWLLIKPCYLAIDLSKLILSKNSEGGLFEGARYVFEIDRRWDRFLRAALLLTTRIGSGASGITSTSDILGELVIADKNVMFVGFVPENAHSTFGLRGPKSEDGSQGVDLLWISSLKRIGRFSVLGYDKVSDDDLKVDCVWVSGPRSGRRFQLGRIRTFDDLKKQANNESSPSHVYRQSAIVVMVLQVLALLGLKSVYDLSVGVWSFLSNLVDRITNQ